MNRLVQNCAVGHGTALTGSVVKVQNKSFSRLLKKVVVHRLLQLPPAKCIVFLLQHLGISWACLGPGSSNMNPKLLTLILVYISQIPRPPPEDALDAAPWLEHCHAFVVVIGVSSPKSLPDYTLPKSKVEICAGQGQLTKALQDCGMAVKSFDVPGSQHTEMSSTRRQRVSCARQVVWIWSQVRYSKNHNLLRTVGFITMLCAALIQAGICGSEKLAFVVRKTLNLPCTLKNFQKTVHRVLLAKVRNMRAGGLVFAGPPCSTWVFLILACV